MRKLFVSSLFLFACAVASHAQFTIFVPSCTGVAATDTAAFTTIKTTVGATNPATIQLPYKSDITKRCKVNNLTLTPNIALDGTNGEIAIVTGQTLTVQGLVIAPARLLFVNATAGLGAVSFSGNTTVKGAPPEWWGGGAAVAATTDTAAWVAATAALVPIASGDILLGPGGYFLNGSGVTLGSNTVGVFTGIGIRGTNGVVGTSVTYSGTADAITVRNGRYNRLTDFSLIKSGAKGTSRGIVITGPGGGGAFTFFSEVERVTVSSFHIGVENGNTASGADADLIDYKHVTLEGNDIGLKVTGANSTMIHAWDTSIGRSATYGVYLAAQGGGQVNWYGGSFGGNTISFYNDGSSANLNLQGIRDEYLNGGVGGTGYQFIRNESSYGTIKVSNYVVAGDGVTVPTYPMISNNGGVVDIVDSVFGSGTDHIIPFGPSTANAQVGGNTSLTMRGNTINENATEFSSNGNLAGMPYRLESNKKLSDAGVYGTWPDDHGVIESLSGNGNRLSLLKNTWNASSSTQALANVNRLLFLNVTAPSTAASGYTELYVNSANKTFSAKDDAGVVKTLVQPDAGSSNNFLTSISTAGVPSKAQPTFSNLATGTAPAFTLGGTVSGGGQQLNNVIIGTVTPLAITGTTVTANTGFVGPHNGTLGATTPAAASVTTLNATGSIASSGTGGVGYATGAGGTVVQSTNKSTGVTLNKTTGTITLNNAALNAGISVAFTLTNSTIAATDIIIVNIKSGATANSYTVSVDAVAAGSCSISLRNYTGGNLSEAVVISFVVIKGVAS